MNVILEKVSDNECQMDFEDREPTVAVVQSVIASCRKNPAIWSVYFICDPKFRHHDAFIDAWDAGSVSKGTKTYAKVRFSIRRSWDG